MNDVHVIDLDKIMNINFKCIGCGWEGQLYVSEKQVTLVCPQCKSDKYLKSKRT